MNLFVLYLLKMSFCSGVLYAYYLLALRNRVFHQYNRFYLLASMFFSLLFPLVPLPSFLSTAPPKEAISLYGLLYFSSGNGAVVAANADKGFDWPLATAVLYALVCLVLCCKLVAGLLQIRLLTLRSVVQRSGNIKFVMTDHEAAPFSFFSWLFWKQHIELESGEGKAIFQHELVHIREKHTVDKLLLQAVLILFWINPVFWLMRRELHLIHEFIADKKAVGQQGAAALAAMMLQAACGRQYQFTNAFFQQPIKRRLAMLHKTLKHPQNAYLGRVLSLPLCALLFFACAKKEEQQVIKEATPTIAKAALNDTSSTFEINKKDSIKTLRVVSKDGVTKMEASKITLHSNEKDTSSNKALLVIDGKEEGPVGDGKKLNAISPEDIESINVLKDEHATKKYGAKGKNGVIEIITKKDKSNSTSGASGLTPRQSPDIVHVEVEKAPSFPGGEQAWRTFLERNLNASTPVENGAPAGTYPTQVQFKVANDGTISDIKTVSSLGYGMEEAVVALLQKSPKWVPAEINGYKVTTIHKQPVTFVVSEE